MLANDGNMRGVDGHGKQVDGKRGLEDIEGSFGNRIGGGKTAMKPRAILSLLTMFVLSVLILTSLASSVFGEPLAEGNPTEKQQTLDAMIEQGFTQTAEASFNQGLTATAMFSTAVQQALEAALTNTAIARTDTPFPTPTITPTATPTPEPRLLIGLVTDVGVVDDGSFNQMSWEGVLAAAGQHNG
ncbi:MAG: hypothetical protein JW910_15830, partial [Anaerolineae bacterium]|nr:hypothetical protein [Anaerolineae bacterium]